MHKIGVLIPDRGDRTQFIDFCLNQINRQSLKPHIVCLFNETPKSDLPDLTYRYRKGFEKLFSEGCDIVFSIENDDWYSDKYIETMYNLWLRNGKPSIIGINSTTYYHIFSQKYRELKHNKHSSMMSTAVTKDVFKIQWPDDTYIFLDKWLWSRMKGVLVTIDDPISLGIKHNIGLCGGKAHDFNWGTDQDKNFHYLSKVVDKEALNFYVGISLLN